MPLYEYLCESCGHRFEKIQKFSDPRETVCPKCGGPVHKLVSSPAIQFKGSGWYITDYAKKSSTDGTKAGGTKEKDKDTKDTKEKADAGSGEAAKTDSSAKSAESPAPSNASNTSGTKGQD